MYHESRKNEGKGGVDDDLEGLNQDGEIELHFMQNGDWLCEAQEVWSHDTRGREYTTFIDASKRWNGEGDYFCNIAHRNCPSTEGIVRALQLRNRLYVL
jgi:hypothetical protein